MDRAFFARETPAVARDLVGGRLEHDDRAVLDGPVRIRRGDAADVVRSTRIGVSGGEDRPLRFLDPDSEYVSAPP